MEATPEGLATAAATREALKRKRPEAAPSVEEQDRKKPHVRSLPTCTHEVECPEGVPERGLDVNVYGTMQDPMYHGTPAKVYPFTLDPFQSTAIACLERRESVLVAAHTSAGKTVVAEYAIAMAFRDRQRVIYTSPIKALSNQKFRELSEQFGEVGLLTGDITINPNANCIVMTTEILRSMIYRGSEILREVAWVIFDEIHYMQDRERGVVWEETIIFMEKDTKMVFLSATLSNAREFASWVAHLHTQPCHVVFTDYRPTPLQHFGHAVGGKGLYLIMDEQGNFISKNFEKLRQELGDKGEGQAGGNELDEKAENGKGGRGGGRGAGGRGGRGAMGGGRGAVNKGKGTNLEIEKFILGLKEKKWEPVIVFSFNRRDCEMMAGKLPKVDFNTPEEKEQVVEVFNNALKCLSEEDRDLPFITGLLPMLKRGIAMHHSGLLPILKELIELLFQEQLLKVLFATETFAMGLNMPARTVVFTSLRKWDGQQFRTTSSGEYIQMSGRAGRRGMDDRGHCVTVVDDQMDEASFKDILQGKPAPLTSSFKLTYYTMLNMLRRLEGNQERNMEFVIAKSFRQFQQEREVPQLKEELARLQTEVDELGAAGDEALSEYTQLRMSLNQLEKQLRGIVLQPQYALDFLRPGRLVRVKEGKTDWGWGVVVNVMHNPPPPTVVTEGQPQNGSNSKDVSFHPASHYIVDTLLACAPGSLSAGRPVPSVPGDPTADMEVIPVGLNLLSALGMLRVSIPEDLRPPESRKAVLLALTSLQSAYPNGLPKLDPLEDMNIKDPVLLEVVNKIEEMEGKLVKNPIYQAERDKEKFAVFAKRAALAAQMDALNAKIRGTQLASFREEAKNRRKVLKKLGHIDAEDVVLLKGRAACEISSTDELLATELMFNGTFNELNKHQVAALCSCLVLVERSNESVTLKNELSGPFRKMEETAKQIVDVSKECKIEINEEEYVEAFRPSLMDVTYHWSKGESFGEVCKRTDIFEGSIVRALRRLDEVMQELERAAQVVGDNGLALKFNEANQTIRRDIVFAASLYI